MENCEIFMRHLTHSVAVHLDRKDQMVVLTLFFIDLVDEKGHGFIREFLEVLVGAKQRSLEDVTVPTDVKGRHHDVPVGIQFLLLHDFHRTQKNEIIDTKNSSYIYCSYNEV